MKTLRKLLLLSAIAIGISFGSAQAQPQGPYGLVQLKAYIDSLIYNNTTHDITGQRLNDVLTTIINSLQNTVDEDDFTFIDTIDVSADPDYPEADAGDVYLALVPGKIGGPSGLEVNVGDMMVCLFDSTPSGDQVTVGEFWNVLQGRLTTDFYDAIENANAPDAANPFATMTDIAGFAPGSTDITWANLLTDIGGSDLTPFSWYHVTTAPDGSTTIDEAWVQAKDSNEIFPDGMCLVNATNITNRLMQIKFFMAGGVGGKIAEVHDALKNVVEGYSVTAGGTSSTANIDAWLNLLTAANQGVKIYGSVLGGGASGTIGDYAELIGSTVQIAGGSNLVGTALNASTIVLDNGANANGVYVLGGLTLDNGTTLANGYVGIGKALTITDAGSYVGFSTEGNTYVHQDGLNPSGDNVTVAATDGIVYIVDGSTDITVNMPTGLIDGQQMIIFFKNGSAAVTWGGSVDVSFIAAPPAGWRLNTFWDATNTTWR